MVRAHATAAGSSELLATMEGVTQALFGGADPKATVRKWTAVKRDARKAKKVDKKDENESISFSAGLSSA